MFVHVLAIFAERFNVAVADAYVLPALFEHSAKIADMPVSALIAEATYRNQPLGEYMADRAAVVAKQDRGE
jgi:hypothetical protein